VAGRVPDPSSPLEDFGDRVRKYRVAASMSQVDLAEAANVSKSHISKIERGRGRCDRKIAVVLDKVFDSERELQSLWDELVKDAAVPTWFDWPKIEASPDTISLDSYECLVVPGLLQTEGYAEALLGGDSGKVAFRMDRQGLLTREDPQPPRTSFLLSETALYNQVGGKKAMREQLEHLLSLDTPRLSIQILPYPMPPAGSDGSFCLATMANRSELVYVETPARGFTLNETDDIQIISDKLADIRARALPIDLSRDLIRRVMEDRWLT